MSSNLFIAYDLHNKPSENYDAVHSAIKELGQWHQFQQSLFYLHTTMTAAEVSAHVWAHMYSDDKLAVIDAQAGVVSNWDKPPILAINSIWNN